jgi:Protein of unknown function (DUF551)
MTDAEFLKNFVFEAHALYHIDDAALNEIKAIAQRLEDDEWLSVNDKLPLSRQTVLTTGTRNRITIRKFCVGRFAECTEKITHWKPLPKGPL